MYPSTEAKPKCEEVNLDYSLKLANPKGYSDRFYIMVENTWRAYVSEGEIIPSLLYNAPELGLSDFFSEKYPH